MSGVVPVLGVLAGIVAVADVIPYIRDTIRRSTCPHRGTWLIWAVLSIVVCLSQRADGASWSLIMSGAQAVLTGLIFLLAIRLGTAGASRADALVIAIAGVGVAGWLIAEQPIVATGCVVVAADLIAAGLMVPKTWREPDSETLSTFAFASVGGALAVGSVGSAPMFRAAREIKVRATSQEAARRAGPTPHSYAPEWVDHYAGRGRISASADRLRACVLRGEVSGRGPTSR